jgi:uncharacterized membrane protein YebE (DUF533 family)
VHRLTITSQSCVETLSILISVAWADGRLDEREKAGVRGAVKVFNLTLEHRNRLESLLAKATPIEELPLGSLSPRDRAFAYVAAAWLCRADDDVDAKEEGTLWRLADRLELGDEKKTELERIARELPREAGDRKWADEVVALFKAIAPRLEPKVVTDAEIEVTFE